MLYATEQILAWACLGCTIGAGGQMLRFPLAEVHMEALGVSSE